jgi:hypothetical protein
MSTPQYLYLSRRNLQTLLNKLDRTAAGDPSACTLIKRDNVHPTHASSMAFCAVVAVEDEDYYTDRAPGDIHNKDQP